MRGACIPSSARESEDSRTDGPVRKHFSLNAHTCWSNANTKQVQLKVLYMPYTKTVRMASALQKGYISFMIAFIKIIETQNSMANLAA